MSDVVVSWIRTAVPAIWAAAVTWLLSAVDWLAPALEFLQLDPTSPGVVAGVVVVAIAAWHGIWRKIEPHVPDWLSRLALGSSRQPTYPAAPVVDEPHVGGTVTSTALDPETLARERERIEQRIDARHLAADAQAADNDRNGFPYVP